MSNANSKCLEASSFSGQMLKRFHSCYTYDGNVYIVMKGMLSKKDVLAIIHSSRGLLHSNPPPCYFCTSHFAQWNVPKPVIAMCKQRTVIEMYEGDDAPRMHNIISNVVDHMNRRAERGKQSHVAGFLDSMRMKEPA